MANRTFYPSKSYGSSRVYLELRFLAPGAGVSVDDANIDGADAVGSIAHVAGTNKLTVTLKDAFNKAIGAQASVLEDQAAGEGRKATVGNFANEGTATALSFAVYTWNADGTAFNDPDQPITLTIALRNGSWGVK